MPFSLFKNYFVEPKGHMEEYIAQNLCLQHCSEYKENLAKHGQDICVCGRQKSWHDSHRKQSSTEKKNKSKPNVPVYGTLQFRGFGKQTFSKDVQYVKVNDYTGLEYINGIWTLMLDYWQLAPPKLIITVSGGAKRFDLNSRLSNALKKGLVNSSAKTGAWLVTGGTKTGVRELVGEAVRDYYCSQNAINAPVVCLGIVTWGIIHNRQVLVSDDGQGSFPAMYKSSGEDTSQLPRGISVLDPNHTHFIFVDKGDSKEFNNNEFQSTLMGACKIEGVQNEAEKALQVPNLVVMINGGVGTVQSIYKYVHLLGVPVVVVSGSGRAADFLALACSKVTYTDTDEVLIPPDFDESMARSAYSMFEWSKETDTQRQEMTEKAVQQCRVIVTCKRYLTIFHTDSEYKNELDNAILDALFKANKPSLKTQLHLALSWNQCSVASDKIFTVENKNSWKTKEGMDHLHNAMFQALVNNQLDFVELLLDNGVEWDRFLTVPILRDLYNEMIKRETCACSTRELLRDILFTQIIPSGSYSCGRQSRNNLLDSNILFHIGHLISYLFDYQIENFYKAKEYRIPKDTSGKETKGPVPKDFTPMRELFLWAVLLNRKELALLFWKQCDCNIVAAQLGNVLLKALAEIAADNVEAEQSAELKESAAFFEKHAVGVLDESYQTDKAMAHRLLVRECPQWGSNTVFSMADSGEQMDMMAQSACQTKLSKIWMGKMVKDTSMYKVILCVIFPPLLLWIKFVESHWKPEDMKMVKAATELLGDSDNKVLPELIEQHEQTKSKDQQVYTVRCCGGCQDENSIGFFFAYYYYLQAPVVKFLYHNIAYVFFLLLFGYFLTVELRPFNEDNWVSWAEYFIWLTAVTLFTEELRQLSTEVNLSVVSKIAAYFSNAWNLFDAVSHFLLTQSVILRFVLPPEHFLWARIAYGLTLMCFVMRFLQSFFVSQDMGPKVLMIRRMMKDLLFFFSLLFLFIVAYGVVLQSVRFPNSALGWPLIKNVLFIPYFNIYGELFLENLEGEIDCTTNKTELSLNSDLVECPQTNEFVTLILALYLLMSNILLLNLLIAMFSYTFEVIQENSEKVWRFYRYSLIYEYHDRPTLISPLIILNHLWRAILWMYRVCKKLPPNNTEFRIRLPDDESRRLCTFERLAMERYLHALYRDETSSMTAKITTTHNRIEKMSDDVETVKEKLGKGLKVSSNEEPPQEYRQPVQSVPPSADNADVKQMKSELSSLKSQMTQVLTLLEKMDVKLTELDPPSNAVYQLPDFSEASLTRRKSFPRETSVTTFTAPKEG